MSRTPSLPPSSPAIQPVTAAFPASITNPERGRSRRRRVAVAAGAVVVLAAGGLAISHAAAAPATPFRTGTASAQHIDRLLTAVAVLEPVSQASVAFPRSGTVATVDVAVGARVAAGQTLATLDASALTDAIEAEQAALTAAQANLANGSTATTTGAASAATTPTTTGSGTAAGTHTTEGAGSPSGSGTSPSAETSLASLQHPVDVAAADLAVAQQALTQATIVSPIAGTVAAVDLAAGDAVTAASTTATIVVVGDGGLEATTTVGIDDLPQVHVGQIAEVVPDGAHATLAGRVSRVAVTPDSSSTANMYRVFITLDGDTSHLGNGSTGSVSIVTSSADAAVAVPTSAVTTTGTQHSVTVFDGTSTNVVRVQVGTVGDTWTQITSGLTNGQQVVLADLAAPLPSAATVTSTATRQGQVGQGGAGGARTGFPGGGGLPSGAPPGQR